MHFNSKIFTLCYFKIPVKLFINLTRMQNDVSSWKELPEIVQCLALLLTGNLAGFALKINVPV